MGLGKSRGERGCSMMRKTTVTYWVKDILGYCIVLNIGKSRRGLLHLEEYLDCRVKNGAVFAEEYLDVESRRGRIC